MFRGSPFSEKLGVVRIRSSDNVSIDVEMSLSSRNVLCMMAPRSLKWVINLVTKARHNNT